MARQYVLTDRELDQLVDCLELEKLRAADRTGKSAVHKQDIDDLHRTFHYYVVRWVQDVAGKKS